MQECPICYSEYTHGINCFGKCSLQVCCACFEKLLVGRDVFVVYDCPQCRHCSILNVTAKFTRMVLRSPRYMRRVITILSHELLQLSFEQMV